MHNSLIPRQDTTTDNTFRLYHYDPSLTGAVVFIVLFTGTTLLHAWQVYRNRCYFMIPLLLGGIFEIVGYCGRVASSKESPNWTLGPYIIQAILILVAPALFAATIYIELGRIVLLLDGTKQSLVKPKWLTRVFVTGDLVSFLLQAGGGGYQAAGTPSAVTTGAHIIVGGLFVQLTFFGFFVVTAISFNTAYRRAHKTTQRIPHWQKHMVILFLTSALIMVRSVFRAVEYLQGFNGYLLSNEAFLYVFDATLMFLVMVLFGIVHPSKILGPKRQEVALMSTWV